MRNLSFQFSYVVHTVLFCYLSCISFNAKLVYGEDCSNGFELACEWLHDDKSALKWVFNTDDEGNNVVELKECEYPNCGVGVITTMWLEPRYQEEWISFSYKIYGTSDVYLRIYLRTVDGGSGQHQIFSQTGNYAYEFPKTWTERDILLPAVASKHRLLIKAHIPFKEAYVAVKDIVLKGNTLITSTTSATSNLEREDEIETETAELMLKPIITEINATDIFTNVSSELSLSGENWYTWNGALSSARVFDFLNITFLPSSLQHTLKYLCMILTLLFIMKTRMNY